MKESPRSLESLSDVVVTARAAFLQFDRSTLEEVATRLAWQPAPASAQAEVELGLARAFCAFVKGEPAPGGLDLLAARAAGARMAAAVVEVRALRALFAIEAGDAAAGLAHARRASLMARTEAIFDAELLANLALARARRYSRQTHLALRILQALDEVAPPAWRPWLDWERSLAGSTPGDPSARAPLALQRLLGAAQAGDRERFRRHAGELRAGELAEPLRRDAAVLIAAIDPLEPLPLEPLSLETLPRGLLPQEPALDGPGRPLPLGAELAGWRQGRTTLPPASLHGLAVQSAACVMLWPSGESARCLHVGRPLLAGPQVAQLRQSRLAHGRVETLLAVLASAGPRGLDEAACFARAYGFSYVPGLHRGVFDVLIHRARGAVEGIASIARERGRVAITTTRPLLIPDPRTSRSTTDRVLRLLAERGRASAKEAAARLGVSLRTVQAALSDLTASQACAVEREGRNVAYVVEDSVFSEPTRRMARLQQELAAGA